MGYNTITFDGFNGRKEELENIKRFNSLQPMYYRTNDYSHSYHVLWLAEELLPYTVQALPGIDVEMTRTISLIHDDPEIIIGDIEFDQKLKMSPDELHKLKQDESAAIEILSARFPQTINSFNYRELLYHALRKDCVEAQLVSYADKIDAFGEAVHEIYAGNAQFIASAGRYNLVFSDLKKTRWPLIKSLFNSGHPFFSDPIVQDLEAIANNGTVHTLESINHKTGHPHYDCWKRVMLERSGIESLVTIKEHKIL